MKEKNLNAVEAFIHEDRADEELVDLSNTPSFDAREEEEWLKRQHKLLTFKDLSGNTMLDLGYTPESFDEEGVDSSFLDGYDSLDEVWYDGYFTQYPDRAGEGVWHEGHLISDNLAMKKGYCDAEAMMDVSRLMRRD